jgi:cytochrome oxidase Cu insertion factor (SCO1/SenC/PrrC family)
LGYVYRNLILRKQFLLLPLVFACSLIITGCVQSNDNDQFLGTTLTIHKGYGYSLEDHLGNTVTSQTQVPTILTFMFTNCTDVCPIVTSSINRALEGLSHHAKVDVHLISVDPSRDTLASRNTYISKWNLPQNWFYLSGDEQELKQIWDAYFVKPQKGESDNIKKSISSLFKERYQVVHTAPVYLLDSKGRPRVIHTNPISVEDLKADILTVSKQ